MSDTISATNLAVDIGMGYMAVTSLTGPDSSNTTKLLAAGAGAYAGHQMYKAFADIPGALEHPLASIKDVFSGKGSLGEDLTVGGIGYGAYKGGSAAYNYATQGGTASTEEAAEVGAETSAEATEIATTTAEATEVASGAAESVGVGAEILGGLESAAEFLPFLLI